MSSSSSSSQAPLPKKSYRSQLIELFQSNNQTDLQGLSVIDLTSSQNSLDDSSSSERSQQVDSILGGFCLKDSLENDSTSNSQSNQSKSKPSQFAPGANTRLGMSGISQVSQQSMNHSQQVKPMFGFGSKAKIGAVESKSPSKEVRSGFKLPFSSFKEGPKQPKQPKPSKKLRKQESKKSDKSKDTKKSSNRFSKFGKRRQSSSQRQRTQKQTLADSSRPLVNPQLPMRQLTEIQQQEDIEEKNSSFESKDDTIKPLSLHTHQELHLSRIQRMLLKLRIQIPTSSVAYQTWKLLLIILSFVSSFQYAHYASFYDRMSEEEKQRVKNYDMFYFVIFFLDMLSHVLVVETTREGEFQKKELTVTIALDLFAIIPFKQIVTAFVPEQSNELQLLFLSKIVRLYHGFNLLNYKQYTWQIKEMRRKSLEGAKQTDTNPMEDKVKIQGIYLLSQVLKTIQLVIILYCISYFTGIFWYLFCKQDTTGEGFLREFGLTTTQIDFTLTTLTYFAFTTLSTVGLGDYHPRSDNERVFGAFILLFGVLITSVIMDNFNNMLKNLNDINNPYTDFEKLYLFIGTIQRFNGDEPMPSKEVHELVNYFQYRQQHDKKQTENRQIYQILPLEVEHKIYEAFFYGPFMAKFKCYFDLPLIIPLKRKFMQLKIIMEEDSRILSLRRQNTQPELLSHPTTKWFILNFLKTLEPRLLNQGEVISAQHGPVEEAIFPMNFDVKVGFSYKHQVRKMKDKHVFRKSQRRSILEEPLPEDGNNLSFVNGLNDFMKQLIVDKSEGFNDGQAQKPFLDSQQFPITLKHGSAIGFFELIFQTSSMFTYKLLFSRELDSEHSHENQALFIRRTSLKRLLLELERLKDGRNILDKFQDNILLLFQERIYTPVKEYQDKQEESFSRREEQNKQQMATNILSLLLNKNKTMTSAKENHKEELPIRPEDVTLEDRAKLVEELVDYKLPAHYQVRKVLSLCQNLRETDRAYKKKVTFSGELKAMKVKLEQKTDHILRILAHFDAHIAKLSREREVQANMDLEISGFKIEVEELRSQVAHLSKENNFLRNQISKRDEENRDLSAELRAIKKKKRKSKETQTDVEEPVGPQDQSPSTVRPEQDSDDQATPRRKETRKKTIRFDLQQSPEKAENESEAQSSEARIEHLGKEVQLDGPEVMSINFEGENSQSKHHLHQDFVSLRSGAFSVESSVLDRGIQIRRQNAKVKIGDLSSQSKRGSLKVSSSLSKFMQGSSDRPNSSSIALPITQSQGFELGKDIDLPRDDGANSQGYRGSPRFDDPSLAFRGVRNIEIETKQVEIRSELSRSSLQSIQKQSTEGGVTYRSSRIVPSRLATQKPREKKQSQFQKVRTAKQAVKNMPTISEANSSEIMQHRITTRMMQEETGRAGVQNWNDFKIEAKVMEEDSMSNLSDQNDLEEQLARKNRQVNDQRSSEASSISEKLPAKAKQVTVMSRSISEDIIEEDSKTPQSHSVVHHQTTILEEIFSQISVVEEHRS